MVKIFYDKDADLNVLKDKTIAVIGYGIQGAGQAQNLHDSGLDVIVGVRKGGESWGQAKADGLAVMSMSDAAKKGDLIQMLVPDEFQATIYNSEIAPHLSEGKTLSFSHGFNIHYNQIVPPKDVNVIMVPATALTVKNTGECRRTTIKFIFMRLQQDATGNA